MIINSCWCREICSVCSIIFDEPRSDWYLIGGKCVGEVFACFRYV